jgi:hypothetical protein
MKALREIAAEDVDTDYLRHQFWQQMLFKWGFPPWLIDHAAEKRYDWTRIIRDLHSGKVAQWIKGMLQYVPQVLQESILIKLTAMAMEESDQSVDTEALRLSLLLDGFEMSQGKMLRAEGPVSVTKERSRLITDLEASSFARKRFISKHLEDAEDLFTEGKMHPAMAEARSAFQAGIEDTVSCVQLTVPRRSGGGLKNQIEFLSRESFFSSDEEQAFLAAWGFLCAGAHPGLPPDEVGRIGLILALEFTQVLLIKARTLL